MSDTLQTISGCDSIVYLDLQVNYSNTGVDSLTSCDSLTWIDGITYYQNNQQATYTIQNQFGCDSVVTLELEINYADQSSIQLTHAIISSGMVKYLTLWNLY